MDFNLKLSEDQVDALIELLERSPLAVARELMEDIEKQVNEQTGGTD